MHIWNPLIKAIILDSQYEGGNEILFLTSPIIFKILSLVRKPKQQFYGRQMTLYCYSHPMARDKLKKKTGKVEHHAK